MIDDSSSRSSCSRSPSFPKLTLSKPLTLETRGPSKTRGSLTHDKASDLPAALHDGEDDVRLALAADRVPHRQAARTADGHDHHSFLGLYPNSVADLNRGGKRGEGVGNVRL